MLANSSNKSLVHRERTRAVFILIALAGILPSALVLWFASLAVRNEQLAAAKAEEESHQVLLSQIKSDLIQGWNVLLAETDQRVDGLPPAVAFYETITSGSADGLVLISKDAHRVTYPLSASELAARNSREDLSAQLAGQF